ncbi:transcriptional regulatory protein CpxR [Escherichia coli]|nr:transcriptional regulatory protein CpxR [Escherichia coli]
MNKILLVDDDRELTSLLKELLEMEGFNVIVAHDGNRRLIFWTTALIYFCLM